LLADRDADGLAAAAAKIGAAAAICVVDLSDNDCGDVIIAAAFAHMGGIDAVVSNAGIIAAGALVDLEPEDFDRIYAVNTKANWALAKAAYPHLVASKGAFVATASMSASQPTPRLHCSCWSASLRLNGVRTEFAATQYRRGRLTLR
jgi:NAD(P)-dependent dehydrogenase (short-subunit alcohol dehydrogenase family)